MFTTATPAPADLPGRLSLIVDLLRRHLGWRAAKDRALAAMLLVLWKRLNRTLSQFAALVGRHRAGTLRPAGRPRTRKTSVPPPRDVLPRGRGWLLRCTDGCAVYGEYLRLLLDEPDMAALLAASPQARRLLRPLWRMLRTEPAPPALRPPPPVQPPPPPPPPRTPGRCHPGSSRPERPSAASAASGRRTPAAGAAVPVAGSSIKHRA